MVILFKGTDKCDNNAPQAVSLCAGLSATKYLKKTLILQFTTRYPVEKFLIGKRISDESLDDNRYFFEDTGMDSLTRRAGVKTFTETHFANAVIPAISSERLFDIMKVSKKTETDVSMEIVKDPEAFGTIIKSARKIYDNIFILCDGKEVSVVDAVLPYTDKSVTCIKQGKKEEVSTKDVKDSMYLLTDFDYKSQFSAHYMQKLYNAGKIFVMPYNVDFKDYYTNENMIQYILSNTEPEKSDYSYHLISEMVKLTKKLLDEDDYIDEEFKFTKKTVKRYAVEKKVLSGRNVKVEVTEKKLFRPSKTLVHISEDGKFKEEGSKVVKAKKLKKVKADKKKERTDKKSITLGQRDEDLKRKEA